MTLIPWNAPSPKSASWITRIRLGAPTRPLVSSLKKLRAEFRSCWGYFEDVVRRQVALSGSAEGDLISRFQTFLDRRYSLLHIKLKDSGDAGVEVLAHTFRQVREFRAYVSALQDDCKPGTMLFAYEASSTIFSGRLHALMRLAAKNLLSADSLGGSSFAAPPLGAATLSPQHAGIASLPAQGGHSGLAPSTLPVLSPLVAAGAPASLALGPASTPAPATPVPVAAPPPSERRKQKRVTYMDSPSFAAGQRVKSETGGDSSAKDSSHKPFCGQPAHQWLVGSRCAPVEPGRVLHPECKCAAMHSHLGIGVHATWDCPLRYIQLFGRCPGFDHGGLRDPRAWHGDQLTDAAKAEWVGFIRKHHLQTARGIGEPDFS